MTTEITPAADAVADLITPAADAVADLITTNRPTDGVAPPMPVTEGDSAAPSRMAAGDALAPPEMDNKGNAFDRARHYVDPVTGKGRITARGTWQLAGTRGAPFPRGNQAAAKATASNDVTGPGQSPQPTPESPAPAPRGFIGAIDPEVMPPAGNDQAATSVPKEAYRSTAEAAHRALFSVAGIMFGRAWDPDAAETRAWVEAWQEALFQWQAPRLGPTLTLVVLAITSAAKRKDDEQTRRRVSELFGWVRRRQDQGQRPQAPAQGQGQAQTRPPGSFGGAPMAIMPGPEVYQWR
jgi:hypothetical protein